MDSLYPRLSIPLRPIHIALLLLLAYLCYQGHQLVRHLASAALCGGFGTMTFGVTVTREPCALPLLVTLSGPVFTYALGYIGMLLLRSPRYGLFGFALIFASFTPLRWIQALTGRGDELVLAQLWTPEPGRLLVAALVFLIGVPPAWAAYRALANEHRVRAFIVTYLLPLPVLFVLLFANRALFGENGDRVSGPLVLGIPPVVLVVALAAAALFVLLWQRTGKVDS